MEKIDWSHIKQRRLLPDDTIENDSTPEEHAQFMEWLKNHHLSDAEIEDMNAQYKALEELDNEDD